MTRRRVLIPVLIVVIAILAALLLLSKFGLSVTRLTLEFSNLPRGFDGFKVVQLSDLHGSEFGKDNARLIEAVAAEEPDIIALTGDFLDEGGAGRELPGVEALARELVKIAPVYFVSGNHDWASGAAQELFDALEAAGVTCLRNDFLTLERGGDSLVLAGVEDPNGPADMEGPETFVSRLRAAAPAAFVLLLAHRAYWAERHPGLDVDLILCGHTHGGIVRLPFIGGVAGTNFSLFPEYDAGLFDAGRYKLFISRGLGNSVPLPRFLNTPEIASVTLKRA